MIRLAVVLLLSCLFISAVLAKDAKVGTVSLKLAPPAGYCDTDAAQPSDARIIKAIGDALGSSGNRLLAMSADCRQLDDWRAGKQKLLDNFAQFQTLVRLENGPPLTNPRAAITEACNQLRAQGEQIVSGITPDIKSRVEQVLPTVRVNEMKFLGVVGEDPLVCYAALLQKIRTEFGTDKTQVSVYATTIIKGKVIYYYLFAPYVSGGTVTTMLAQHRANIASLQRANPD